jgi:glycosyltransferase involved in cell wall biosynthesis
LTLPDPARRPKVLMAHTFYRFLGGENLSFLAELELLRAQGHPVVAWTRDNREIDAYGPLRRAALPLRTVWDPAAYRELRALLARERPRVAHFQNTFPLLSPAVYHACRRAGVAVVQTLRNYRLLCPSGILYRDGHLCGDCLGRGLAWPGVVHACYRGSRAQTAVVAAMLGTHRLLGTWRDEVDLFVVPSEFARRQFLAAGLEPERVVTKPNFIAPDPGPRAEPGDYALFVGRLTEEKGVRTLLAAWRGDPGLPLRIVGEGPLRNELEAAAGEGAMVRWLGERPHAEVLALIKGARLVVFPSEWYETFGRVAMEAFACGVPLVAARLGAMAELVEEGVTGLLFRPGEAADLLRVVRRALADPAALLAMGAAGRRAYEERYTAERNYELLCAIYGQAIERAARR